MSSDSQREWEDVKEEIRSRADIISVVEDYVSLEKRGQNHWALCPFHAEDTPSFSVNPDLGIYKCFGCGNGGDVFSFIQEIEQCDFMESLRLLSDRTGIELPSRDDSDDAGDSPRRKMFDMNEYASNCYRDAFEDSAGSNARQYMKDRNFSEEILETFNVGYAPDGWDNLLRAMKRDGYDPRWAMKVGLIDKSDKADRVYDKFRNRVMFPIETPAGRVVGFGGRQLDDDEEGPKYLNSQESPIFSKRQTLYGLAQARSSIRHQDRCLLMEGYTDVIKCHQFGHETALASLGTAMTEQHVQTLRRYANEVVLVYDGDEAGRRAARRGGEIAVKNGMNASVVLLPEGQDPADVLDESPDRFQEYLDNRKPYLDVVLEWLLEDHDAGSSDGKSNILEEIIPLVNELSSEVQREDEARKLAKRLSVKDETVLELMNRETDQRSGDGGQPFEEKIKSSSGVSIEESLFRCLGEKPGSFQKVMDIVALKDFSSQRGKILFKTLRSIEQSEDKFSVKRWLREIPEEHVSYLAGILNREEGAEHVRQIDDPVKVARKMKSDSARRQRVRLKEELEQQDEEGRAGTMDETKKALIEQAQEMKREESKSDDG